VRLDAKDITTPTKQSQPQSGILRVMGKKLKKLLRIFWSTVIRQMELLIYYGILLHNYFFNLFRNGVMVSWTLKAVQEIDRLFFVRNYW